MRPVMPQARAISSTTSTTSSSGRSPPPWAAGTVMPMKPAATRSFTLSQGYSSRASQRAARSAKTESASSRALARSASCSVVSGKDIGSARSDVDGLAERGQRGLEGGFGERRMRVDRVHDLLERGLERPAHRELVDDLRRLGTDDMHAEDLAGGLVRHDLDEAVGLAQRHRLAAGGERELAD